MINKNKVSSWILPDLSVSSSDALMIGGGGGVGLLIDGGNGGDIVITWSGGGVVEISIASSQLCVSGRGYSHWLSPVARFW